MTNFHSQFGGLWTDQSNAMNILEDRFQQGQYSEEQHQQLKHYIEYGYLVIPSVISTDQADTIRQQMNHAGEFEGKYLGRIKRKLTYATEENCRDPKFRFVDFHINCKTALDAATAPAIVDFLSLVFEDKVLAFQSLAFIQGSQQRVHQDTAYVCVSDPIKLAASWIALEDVSPGCGELEYYPGSQKFPDFLFSEEHKTFHQPRDGFQQNEDYIDWIHNTAAERDISIERFYPKKGDALIWAADLAHGGSKFEDQSRTRYSFVTHYCPASVSPNYRNFWEHFKIIDAGNNACISSRFYRLDEYDGSETLLEALHP